MHQKKIKKINKIFKDIEDFLGQIDYYDGFYKEFVDDKKIPGLITQYAKDQADKKIKEFNKHLKKEEWIGKHKKRLKKSMKNLIQSNGLMKKMTR